MNFISGRLVVLLESWKARLSQRIVFWVFVSLIAIEGILLIPSVQKREKDLLMQFKQLSSVKASSIMMAYPNESAIKLLEQIGNPNVNPAVRVRGGALYESNGKLVGTFGEMPQLSFESLEGENNFYLYAANRSWYEVAWDGNEFDNNYVLIIRYDGLSIKKELWNYTLRIAGLVVLISAVVTSATMIVLGLTVIVPILKLRDDLIVAGDDLSTEKAKTELYSLSVKRSDELGEVMQAFRKMLERVRQEIRDRKRAEAIVREESLQKVQEAQLQLVQSEKMSGLGQLTAGVAHEINNPVGFIAGNIGYAQDHIRDLLEILHLYREQYPDPLPDIANKIEELDLEFIMQDLPALISSMKEGTDRIRQISTAIGTFSRSDTTSKVPFNIHDGLDSTLLILKHRLKANEQRPTIIVIKDYGDLPPIACYPGQLNQVFMNIIANSIDALDELNQGRDYREIKANPNQITIRTEIGHGQLEDKDIEQIKKEHDREITREDPQIINNKTSINKKEYRKCTIRISDNGLGMSEEVLTRSFDYLFTTKMPGKGTGLGLSIARQIVTEKHQGRLSCISVPGKGTEFIIEIPL